VSLSLASVMIKAVTNCDVRMVAFLFLLSSIFWLGQGMTPCHERKALMVGILPPFCPTMFSHASVPLLLQVRHAPSIVVHWLLFLTNLNFYWQLWFQMMVLIIGMAAVMLAMYFPSQGTESDDSMYGAAMKQEGGPGYLSMKSMDALQMGLILSTATPGLTLLDSSIWQARDPRPEHQHTHRTFHVTTPPYCILKSNGTLCHNGTLFAACKVMAS
jgi:hypothetical protein